MSSAVGIRVYSLTLYEKGSKSPVPFHGTSKAQPPANFISEFCAGHLTTTANEERERSWYIEQKAKGTSGNIKGYIHYGTFGFESNFVDSKTKKKNYRRKVTDVEEIPLYFEFWCPPESNHGYAVFQSFQGRSCVQLLASKMKEDYESKNKHFYLNFKKLMPSGGPGGLFGGQPVKRLRLIRRNVSSDLADQYFGTKGSDPIDYELSLSARRSRSLGSLGTIKQSVSSVADGMLVFEGLEFDQAVADIRIGKKVRPIAILNHNSDAGVIDLSESIEKGVDGHPTYDSLASEVSDILKEFHTIMSGS